MNFNNIIVGGGGVDMKTHTVDLAELVTCLKNATPKAGPIIYQDLLLISNWTED